MKRIFAGILASLMLCALLAGCAAQPKTLNIGSLKGPTGMGMVALMDGTYKNYNVTLASAPDEISASLISGALDIAAVPINLASVLYNKLEGDVQILAVNTLGVLYVLEAGDTVMSIADLAGKTVYATGQGSTPEYVLNYLLEKNGIADSVTVEYISEHSELAAQMGAGQIALGMLPEPNATAVLAQNADMHVALDLTEEWNKVCPTQLVQGCIVARKSFVEANKKAVDEFLTDYNASAAFVNEHHEKASMLIESYGIMAKAALAKKAIPRCNIVCVTGADMKTAAFGMLQVLFDANPKSVGGALPGDDFYYGA